MSVSVSSVSMSVIDEPTVSEDGAIDVVDGGGRSSANIRVAFGALPSQGNIGFKGSALAAADGTS